MIIDDYDMLRRLQSYNLSSSCSGLRVVSVFNHFLLIDATDRVGNVLIFEKNNRFVKKTSRKIEKQNDRF